jgi:hypothetical protein
MKTISIFLALLNSLMAALILAFSLSPTEVEQTATWWLLTKVITAASIILVGALTWVGGIRAIHAGLLTLCSLFLVALGAATIVWTLHLVLVTRDIEFYMVVYGGSLILQGIASLFGFVPKTREMTAI